MAATKKKVFVKHKSDLFYSSNGRLGKGDPLVEILEGVPPSEVFYEIRTLQEDHEDCPGVFVEKCILVTREKKIGFYLCSVCARLEKR